jgi:SAM-dependent methyltransferase
MNPEEYALMAEVEDSHWWYRGLRDMIGRILQKKFAVQPGANILDAGCGTGGNLSYLAELLQPDYLGGFDSSPAALDYARRKVPRADIYASDICAPQLHVDALDVILTCDVLNVPGLQACSPGVQRLVERLRTGGLLIINVPAYQWLYSRHDLAIHSVQRFTRSEIRRWLAKLGLVVELATYRLCGLFPLFVLSRIRSRASPSQPFSQGSTGLRVPHRALNSSLAGLVKVENRAVMRGVRFPWGSSVFAVARKRA